MSCFGLFVTGYSSLFFFFFQAEDGIRDVAVTGVQTCALPILYIQNASYLKLRELNVGYDLPPDIPRHFGMRTARISLSGRNLLRFSPYKGLDPEVSNFGNQAIARNIDVAPFPPSRSFFFSIDLGF